MKKRNKANYFDTDDNLIENNIGDDYEEKPETESSFFNDSGWVKIGKKDRKKNSFIPEEEMPQIAEDVPEILSNLEDMGETGEFTETDEEHEEKVRAAELAHDERIKKKVDRSAKQRRKFYFILILAVMVLSLVFGVYTYFRAVDIEVLGTSSVTQEYIVSLAGIKPGQHLFTLDKSDIIDNIEQNPYINVKSVKFRFPNRLVITIEENKPAAAVIIGTQAIFLDEDARILKVGLIHETENLPVIDGLGVKSVEVGEELKTDDDSYKLVVAKNIMHYLNLNSMTSSVDSVDLSDINTITMQVGNITVEIGQGDRLNEKIAWAKAIIKTLNAEGTFYGTVDVSTETSAIYKKPESTPEHTEEAEETADIEEDNGEIPEP